MQIFSAIMTILYRSLKVKSKRADFVIGIGHDSFLHKADNGSIARGYPKKQVAYFLKTKYNEKDEFYAVFENRIQAAKSRIYIGGMTI